MVDAAELGHDDRPDPGTEVRGDLEVSDLALTDALAVVFDEEVRKSLSPGIPVRRTGVAGQDPAGREPISFEDRGV